MANSSAYAGLQTNWSLCCLCQKVTRETLSKPKAPETSVYKTLSNNITEFYKLGALPLVLNLQRLDNGKGIEETLKDNNAAYHNSCKLLFKDTKLERANKKHQEMKRNSNQILVDISSSDTKVKRKCTQLGHMLCFICDTEDDKSNLCQVETMQTCLKLKHMAIELNDTKLLDRKSVV